MRILVEAFCWLMQHQHHPWEDNFTSTTLTFPPSLPLTLQRRERRLVGRHTGGAGDGQRVRAAKGLGLLVVVE